MMLISGHYECNDAACGERADTMVRCNCHSTQHNSLCHDQCVSHNCDSVITETRFASIPPNHKTHTTALARCGDEFLFVLH